MLYGRITLAIRLPSEITSVKFFRVLLAEEPELSLDFSLPVFGASIFANKAHFATVWLRVASIANGSRRTCDKGCIGLEQNPTKFNLLSESFPFSHGTCLTVSRSLISSVSHAEYQLTH